MSAVRQGASETARNPRRKQERWDRMPERLKVEESSVVSRYGARAKKEGTRVAVNRNLFPRSRGGVGELQLKKTGNLHGWRKERGAQAPSSAGVDRAVPSTALV